MNSAARTSIAHILLWLYSALIALITTFGTLALVAPALRAPWAALPFLAAATAMWVATAFVVLRIWGTAGIWPRRGPSPVLRAVRSYNSHIRGWRLALVVLVGLIALTFVVFDRLQKPTPQGPPVAWGAYAIAIVIALTGVIVSAACILPGPPSPNSPRGSARQRS